MAKFTRKKKVVIIAAALTLTGTAAFAYWTTGGSGSDTSQAGTSASVTVNQTNTEITTLAPGGTAALSGTITNADTTTSYDVTAVTAVVDDFSVQGDLGQPACTEADFSVSGTSTNPAVVAPSSTGGAWSGLSLNMVNGVANQDNCQGVTIPVTYTAS